MRISVGMAAALLCMLAHAASAAEVDTARANGPVTVKLFPGWDFTSEPLDLRRSSASWELVDCAGKTKCSLKVDVSLVGAQPNKLYQIGFHLLKLCKSPPPAFGAFTLNPTSGCEVITRDGATDGVMAAELGVVTTDSAGRGSLSVIVRRPAKRDYKVIFTVRNGAGCNVSGGGGNGACGIAFRSPETFNDSYTIRIR